MVLWMQCYRGMTSCAITDELIAGCLISDKCYHWVIYSWQLSRAARPTHSSMGTSLQVCLEIIRFLITLSFSFLLISKETNLPMSSEPLTAYTDLYVLVKLKCTWFSIIKAHHRYAINFVLSNHLNFSCYKV